MTDQNKPRRPVAGSRAAGAAPRRIAGRARSAPEQPDVEQPDLEQPDLERPDLERPAVQRESPSETIEDLDALVPAEADTEAESGTGPLSSRRTTKVLVVLLSLLLLVGVAEAVVWAVAQREDEVQRTLSFDEEYAVSDEPVTVPVADWRDANDAAAKAVTQILTVSWKDYDKNLEDARELLTDNFEEEYANTTKDSRDLFIKSKAEYDFAVVGQSVVEATPDEVSTLLFLNQFVYKGEGTERTGPEIYPARVMVRMVRTDGGWLIDEMSAL